VAVVGAAEAADDIHVRQAGMEQAVLLGELGRVSLVELLGLVQLSMALPSPASQASFAPQSAFARQVGVSGTAVRPRPAASAT
jgi:hypothetical protein